MSDDARERSPAYITAHNTLPKEIGNAMAKARFHRLTPTWIRLTDNTSGFGHKEAIHLDAEGGPR